MKYNEKQLEAFKLLNDDSKPYVKLWGGSRSGKTALIVEWIRRRAFNYPGSKHIILRYSFANAKKTIWLQTILPEFKPFEKKGLCKITYTEGIINLKNGSSIMLGGLEPSRIDAVLGAEYGTIFVTEANENSYTVFENLFSRLNDTAVNCIKESKKYGQKINPKLVIDLNPTVETSWTNRLFIKGIDPSSEKSRKDFNLFGNVHFSPYDNKDNLSKGYLQTLENLSPAKRKRFLYGIYGSYEGLVFPTIEEIHIVDDFKIPDNWDKYRAIDFGYTHPFVCLWGAYDKANDCLYIYREHSERFKTVVQHSEIIKEKSGNERYASPAICDHDAEDRATLEQNGIDTEKANKSVLLGIDNVNELLSTENGKRTNVKIFRSCVKLRDSLNSYVWKKGTENLSSSKDREVLKIDDDEADAFRYLCMRVFPPQDGFEFMRIGPNGASKAFNYFQV